MTVSVALSRAVLVPVALSHLFAANGLWGGWSQYRSPVAAIGLLVISWGLPGYLARAAGRSPGAVPARVTAIVVGGLLGISVAVPALLPAGERGSFAAWNWGTGAIGLLCLALFVPVRQALIPAVVHGLLAVVTVLASGADLWTAHLVLVSALVPPLAGVQFARFYAEAVHRRAQAVPARAEAEADRQQVQDLRLAEVRRLGAVREEIEPLLAFAAAPGRLPLEPERARTAQLLAERLREALVAHRQVLWLPDRVGSTPVTVVCPPGVAEATAEEERAWLEALIELLAVYPGWSGARLVLDAGPSCDVTAVFTATGTAVGAAAADDQVQALCASRRARLEVDGGMLVVEACLRGLRSEPEVVR